MSGFPSWSDNFRRISYLALDAGPIFNECKKNPDQDERIEDFELSNEAKFQRLIGRCWNATLCRRPFSFNE